MTQPTVDLRNKLALVTGASGAIGSAIARRLAQDGASVLVHYRSGDEAAFDVVRAIVAAGGDAESVHADLGLRDGPAQLIAQLDLCFERRFAGRLDVLVNNAATLAFGSLVDTTDEDFDESFDLNVRAPFQLAREAARRMSASGWGRIVNVGSVFGEASTAPGLGVYCGTKFAIRGLTRAWSRDLGALGVTVNNVQPAVIQTQPAPVDGPAFDAMRRNTSVGRFGTPGEIASAVAFLASPSAGFINGESLTVDGGWSA